MTKTSEALMRRLNTPLTRDPVAKINDLIAAQNTLEQVQSLEGSTLFRLIKDAGFDQGIDLIPFATPEQIQTFLDFDVWRRGDFVTARMHRWLGAVVDSTPEGLFRRVLREMDSEVIALYVKRGLHVELMEEGEIPDHMPDKTQRSLDGVYAIVYPEDDVHAAVLRKLMDRLFDEDRVLAWTLLEAARWELDSEMESFAHRWRQGRLEEEGFVPRDEAMGVYRPLDPAKLKQEIEHKTLTPKYAVPTPEQLNTPSVLLSEFDGDFFLLEAFAKIQDDAQLRGLMFELSHLCNRTMVADGIEPGELPSGRQVIRRTLGYASVGLWFLSQGDLDRAIDILSIVPVRDIFRAGYTSASRLQHQSISLLGRPTLTLVEEFSYSLLDPNDVTLMEALGRQRPTYAANEADFDLFRTQAQVDDAALRLGMIAFKQLWLFGIQQFTPEGLTVRVSEGTRMEIQDVTLDVCFATALAHVLIGQPPEVKPLNRQELGHLLKALTEKKWESDPAAAFNPLMAQQPASYVTMTSGLLRRWIEQTLQMFSEELGQVHDIQTAQVITERILLER